MEKGNEEIPEKAVSKDYSVVVYDEIRIEMSLARALKMLAAEKGYDFSAYKLNNVFIPGYKDIGLEGQAVFILRKISDKNAANK